VLLRIELLQDAGATPAESPASRKVQYPCTGIGQIIQREVKEKKNREKIQISAKIRLKGKETKGPDEHQLPVYSFQS